MPFQADKLRAIQDMRTTTSQSIPRVHSNPLFMNSTIASLIGNPGTKFSGFQEESGNGEEPSESVQGDEEGG
jgi:hypothetical protein